MRPIPKQAVAIVAKWEGFEPVAYLDVVGVPTIGYGTIKGVTKADVGKRTITKAEAQRLLMEDMKEAAVDLRARIGGIIEELTDNQYAALISFAYNLGAKNPSWTIWKRLKARQFDQVPGEMMKFVNAGGKKVQGLVNRRTDEVRLWSKDEPGSTHDTVPSHVTRSTPTPPTPADPVSPGKSGTIITAALSAVGAVPVAAQQVQSAVAPYADQSPIVGQMVAIIATLAAGSAIAVLALTWLQKKRMRS